MIVLRLAAASLRNRSVTVVLTVLAIAVSVALVLGIEKVRVGARESFANTISGTDLIVGARGGDIQLLLYSVFRIGASTNNLTWESYQDIAAHPDVAWIVPISLGDSHKGYRVVGTSNDYFAHYRYRRDSGLTFAAGGPLDDLFAAVLGSDVAAALGYHVGDPIVVAHGIGAISFRDHDDKPFRVAGILDKTGTPVDRSVHLSLEGIEAIHIDWAAGAPIPGMHVSPDQVRQMDLQPGAVTAALVGLKSRLAAFRVQRFINEYKPEALSAILPGVALQQLWEMIGTAETALLAVSAMAVITALLGMAAVILSTLNERRREMAILRSVGAHPVTLVSLLVAEAAILTTAGAALGSAALYASLWAVRSWVDAKYGLYLQIDPPATRELAELAIIVAGGLIAGLVPAVRAYRLSVADGMMVRT